MGKFIVEAIATGVLVVVLFGVWLLDPRTRGKNDDDSSTPGGDFKHEVLLGSAKPGGGGSTEEAKPLKLGITTFQQGESFDDMAKLLRDMGQGFNLFEEVAEPDLKSYERLKRYDVLFLTCRINKDLFAVTSIANALQDFVRGGGVIYSSDLRCELIRRAFPEHVDQGLVKARHNLALNPQIEAEIVDPGLRQYLGKDRIGLKFKFAPWETAAFLKSKGTSFVEGDYNYMKDGPNQRGSFLFQFKPYDRGGLVIFTSFHNSDQTTGDIQNVLKYLVFKSMTAKAESQLTEDLKDAGITANTGNLISASSGSGDFTQTYSNDAKGKLVFGLNFPPGSGTLKLTVKNPDGKKVHAKHNSTFRIIIPDAPAGEWTLTVASVEGNAPAFQIITGKEKK